MRPKNLITAEDLLAEAEYWEGLIEQALPGDPMRRLAQNNVDFFLQEAAKKELEQCQNS